MRVLKTGHEIADTVAVALEEGLYGTRSGRIPEPIGYGILRGTAEEFKKSNNYIHLDRGYFKPNHYDGYYRVSLNGTQQTTGLDQFEDDRRFKRLGIEVKPWRGFDKSKPVLVIPPTSDVMRFFNLRNDNYKYTPKKDKIYVSEFEWEAPLNIFTKEPRPVIRNKGDAIPIDFHDYNYVLTFNSSVGWQALQNGIPCVSDPTHSIVGSQYHNISLDNLEEAQYIDRHKLFAIMANLQLSLGEIRAGKICKLVNQLLRLSIH